MSRNVHQADSSYIGYVFQGLFALILLLDAQDENYVSVETQDDVILVGDILTLYQLKHSLNSPAKLSIHDDGFWKTLLVWIDQRDIGNASYVFVTCAEILKDSELEALTTIQSERSDVVAALKNEATRVLDAREAAKVEEKSLPYADRAMACQKFLELSPAKQIILIDNISIKPKSFNANDIEEMVSKKLTILAQESIRIQIVQRLIEWWDRRVVQALLNKQSRKIYKIELQRKIQELSSQYSDNSLPDNFSILKPSSLDDLRGGIMEKQIELVSGGEARIQRSALAQWRARNQRKEWLDKNISLAVILSEYDDTLIEHWQNRHGPMCDDCAESTENEKKCKGKDLLDWSHFTAPSEIPPPRSAWSHEFYVQGSLQQLADELKVGWHPEYKNHIDSKPEVKE